MDRQDIDALLIGALYGELTPADEARLAAHLESHPADKTALDDLKSAREQVKQSRIFELQTEPPQAISAVLLQEAARRAPKKVVASEQHESWFHRFVRSFAAHPAMAAAAMLVLVVGVAATLYMKNGNVGYEKTAGQSDEVTATTPPVAAPPVVEPSAKDQAAAGSAYQVGLADTQLDRKEQVAEGKQETEKTAEDKAPERAKVAQAATPATTTAKADSAGGLESEPAAHAASKSPAKKKGTGYLEVETPQQMPKEMDTADNDGEAYGGDRAAQKQAGPSNKFATPPGGVSGGGAPSGVAVGGAATGAANAAPAQPAPAPQVAAAPPPPPADFAKNAPSKAPAKPSAPPAKTVSKAPAPKAEEAPVEATRGDTDLIAWAKRQHAAAIAKVKAGDCGAAAALAVSVRSQAYGYYQQNMANDRELKGCASYIANAVNREEERTSKPKAAKSAPDEAPAPAQSK